MLDINVKWKSTEYMLNKPHYWRLVSLKGAVPSKFWVIRKEECL